MNNRKYLKIEVFPNFYQRYPVVDRLNIGRGQQNDVVLSELSVSVHHSTIWTQGEDVWIRDEKSTNGTTVNHAILEQPVLLRANDSISVGYVKMVFCEETEARPQQVFDMTVPDLRLPEDWERCEDVMIRFPCDAKKIKSLCELASQGTKLGGDMLESLEEILGAIVSGNPGSEGKLLEFRRRSTADGLEFTLSDPSGKVCPEMWKAFAMPDKDLESPKFHIPKGIDAVEYEKRKNLLILRKRKDAKSKIPSGIPISEEKKRRIAVRYFRRMCTESSFPLDVAIGEGIESLPVSSAEPSLRTLPNRPLPADIVPIFPGCLCSPCLAQVEWNQDPILCRFWITPLGTGSRKGVVQIVKSGKSIPAMEMPFVVGKKGAGIPFLWAAIWLPALLILPALLDPALNREIPKALSSLFSWMQRIGGPWIPALSLGILLAAASVVLFWRACPRISGLLKDSLSEDEN